MSLFNSCFACLILVFQSLVDAFILYSFYFTVSFLIIFTFLIKKKKFIPLLHGPSMIFSTLGFCWVTFEIEPHRSQWVFLQIQTVSVHLGAKVTGLVFLCSINLLFMWFWSEMWQLHCQTVPDTDLGDWFHFTPLQETSQSQAIPAVSSPELCLDRSFIHELSLFYQSLAKMRRPRYILRASIGIFSTHFFPQI